MSDATTTHRSALRSGAGLVTTAAVLATVVVCGPSAAVGQQAKQSSSSGDASLQARISHVHAAYDLNRFATI